MAMTSWLSRRRLLFAAAALLLAAAFVPAPGALFPADAAGLSGVKLLGDDLLSGHGGASWRWIIGEATVWGRVPAGAEGALGFWRIAALTFAFFANVAFFVAMCLGARPHVTRTARAFLAASVAAGAIVVVFFPVFARLPAYWLWLAALASLAWAFIGFEGRGSAASSPFDLAPGGKVPLVVWMWLGFVVFWLGVTYAGAHRDAPSAADAARAAGPTTLVSFFNDGAQLLDAAAAQELNLALQAFEKETSTQIAVATYPSLPSGSLEEFTIAVAERSRLGERGKDNGAILFVFKGEKRARLEVGYGLEGVLTDAASHRILETYLAPAFVRGDYPAGIGTTVAAVLATVKDAYARGWQPDKFTVMMQQVRVALPKVRAQALPVLVQLDFLARFLAAFFGGVFATVACLVAREVLRSGYNLSRLAKRVVSPSAGAAPLTKAGFDEMLSQLKFIGGTLEIVVIATGFALGAIAAVAGVVVLAAGGSFGGAGAMVGW